MSDDNVIRVPRVIRTGPFSALSIWPADAAGVATTTFHSLKPEMEKKITAPHKRKRGSVM
jgi:hypothetical protein